MHIRNIGLTGTMITVAMLSPLYHFLIMSHKYPQITKKKQYQNLKFLNKQVRQHMGALSTITKHIFINIHFNNFILARTNIFIGQTNLRHGVLHFMKRKTPILYTILYCSTISSFPKRAQKVGRRSGHVFVEIIHIEP